MASLLVLATVSVIVSCGNNDGAEQPTAEGGQTEVEVTAELSLLEDAVDVRLADDTAFAAASDGQPLAIDEQVRTDPSGFAQIDYVDGSLARLGPDTVYVVTELSGTPDAPVTRARLDIGSSWHRIAELLPGRGRYEVDTPVATATVRGTTFSVVCETRTGPCTFAVIEGTVEVVPHDGSAVDVTAGQRLVVAAAGAQPLEEPGVDALRDLPWSRRNLDIDEPEGADAGTANPATPTEGLALDACELLTPSEIEQLLHEADPGDEWNEPLAVEAGRPRSLVNDAWCDWRLSVEGYAMVHVTHGPDAQRQYASFVDTFAGTGTPLDDLGQQALVAGSCSAVFDGDFELDACAYPPIVFDGDDRRFAPYSEALLRAAFQRARAALGGAGAA